MDPSPTFGNLQKQKQSANTIDKGRPSDQSLIPKPQADVEFRPLSGKPYFYVVLGRLQYGKRFQLAIPHELSEKLPISTVPTKIVYRGKVWDLLYLGDIRRFGNEGWGKFVTDNSLTAGDACVFELMEGNLKSSILKFKVQILKSDFPSELLEKAEGFNINNPIAIE